MLLTRNHLPRSRFSEASSVRVLLLSTQGGEFTWGDSPPYAMIVKEGVVPTICRDGMVGISITSLSALGVNSLQKGRSGVLRIKY